MKINHTIVQYGLSIAALVAAIVVGVHKPSSVMVPTVTTHEVTHVRVSRFDWPSLGEEKTIALGEVLNTLSSKKVTIYCSNESCQNFRTDLDDAFQIGWWDVDFEDRFVDSEAEKGLFVGPPGEAATALKSAIESTTGLDVKVVPIDGVKGLALIIGKAETR